MPKRHAYLKLYTVLAGLIAVCQSYAQNDVRLDVPGADATNSSAVAGGSNMTEAVAVPVASSGTNESVIAAGDLPKEETQPVVEEDSLYNKARYQPIIARSPFGAYLDEATRVDAAARQEIERTLRLCFILEDTSGEIRAGFQVLRPEEGELRSVILMKGDEYKGWRLEAIDLKGSVATMNYNGSTVPLELTKPTVAANNRNAANARNATTTRNTFTATTTTTRNLGGGLQSATPGTVQRNSSAVRILDQPLNQNANRNYQTISPQELQRQQAEVQRQLQDYQMEVIREGLPPLPVELTPEMDDQLVFEGVLPPRR